MPTGYTVKLHEGTEQTFPEFVMRCARAFGALIDMRDDPLDKPVFDEIFTQEWHQKQKIQAEARLARVEAWNSEEAELAAAQYHSQTVAAIEQSNVLSNARWERYHSVLMQVKRWIPPSSDHQELKDFMIQQLEYAVKHDCYVMDIPAYMSGVAYRQQEIMQARKDIAYHAKEHDADVARAKERTKWIQDLKRNLNQIRIEEMTTLHNYLNKVSQ